MLAVVVVGVYCLAAAAGLRCDFPVEFRCCEWFVVVVDFFEWVAVLRSKDEALPDDDLLPKDEALSLPETGADEPCDILDT